MERYGCAWMRKEDGVQVTSSPLKSRDGRIALGDRVGPPRLLLAIEPVNFLAKHGTLERSAGLTGFFGGQVVGKNGVIKQHCCQRIGLARCIRRRRLAVVFVSEMARNASVPQEHAGVKPGLGQYRRHVGRTLHVRSHGKRFAVAERGEVFGIELLDHAEAAELTLQAIDRKSTRLNSSHL